ncbi:MAG TPA: enoyl-CoA hydratase/isomerase family protein [Micromonosporaceae bacterium]|jgi:enoyl-CoA hydratase/carnithine racemase
MDSAAPMDGFADLPSPDGFRVLRDDHGISVLMIDRTTKRNALTRAMWSAVPTVLNEIAGGTRALIVAGAGGVFCAGADIGELREVYGDPDHARAYHATNLAAEAALAGFPHPTVAAISGWCVGGGLQLALACDIRVADRTARFGLTPAKLGVIYPAAPALRLARLVGPARAKYLMFTADLIDAARAYDFGLIEEITDGPQRAVELARTIASRSPRSIRAARETINTGSAPAEDPADVPEGLAAFLERRPPRFR